MLNRKNLSFLSTLTKNLIATNPDKNATTIPSISPIFSVNFCLEKAISTMLLPSIIGMDNRKDVSAVFSSLSPSIRKVDTVVPLRDIPLIQATPCIMPRIIADNVLFLVISCVLGFNIFGKTSITEVTAKQKGSH